MNLTSSEYQHHQHPGSVNIPKSKYEPPQLYTAPTTDTSKGYWAYETGTSLESYGPNS